MTLPKKQATSSGLLTQAALKRELLRARSIGRRKKLALSGFLFSS
jgi:hypothetical protein